MKNINNRLKFILRIIFGLLIISVIIFKTDFSTIFNEIKNISFVPYLLVIIGHFVLIAIKSLRWYRISKAAGIHMSYPEALRAYTIAFAFGTFTPGQVGDLGKVMLVNVDKDDKKKLLGTAIVDRLWDLIGLTAISFISMVFIFYSLHTVEKIIWIYLGFFCCGLIALVVIFLLRKKILNFIKHKFNIDFRLFFTQKRIAGLLTLSSLTVQFIRWCLLAVATNQPVIWGAFIALFGTFIALIPISISGLGTREACFSFLFRLKGLDASAGIAFSLLMFSTYVIGACGGALVLIFTRGNKKTITFKKNNIEEVVEQ